ncbi:MarR family winged helix-turn-helix transcriptional regulator [Actinoplanes sp. URMC 104]|uniref:MarR family winged helix-turn-helix transcriptional regulator n=1 Tax=Actinoplanes sp. URMC 104 TaxID=3423409 RepID=UPI003F19846F
MHETDTQDAIPQLADELVRFARLMARAKGMLNIGDLGAEFSALMLLFPLHHRGPLRTTDLAEIKQADPSTVSRQVAQLVKAGLARREADPEDGRASRLAITEAGLVAVGKLGKARQDWLGEVLSDWPEGRAAAFAGLFAQFNSSVEAHLATPRENV